MIWSREPLEKLKLSDESVWVCVRESISRRVDVKLDYGAWKQLLKCHTIWDPLCASNGVYLLCVCVCGVCSADVTHVVSEGNAAQELWNWLEEQGFGEMRNKHVLHISWFTESMSAGRPVPVEIRHYIQVSGLEKLIWQSSSVNIPVPFSCQITQFCSGLFLLTKTTSKTTHQHQVLK